LRVIAISETPSPCAFIARTNSRLTGVPTGGRWIIRDLRTRRIIVESTAGLYGDLQGIAGRSLLEIDGLELPLQGAKLLNDLLAANSLQKQVRPPLQDPRAAPISEDSAFNACCLSLLRSA
jgi:hypothetical protein